MKQNDMMAVITLIVGVSVSALVLIFVGALGGQTYGMTEPNIDEIGYDTYNSTFVADNRSWNDVGHPLIHENTFTIVNATNVDKSANFTMNYTTGLVKLGTALPNSSLNGSTFTVDYGYDTSADGATIRDNIKDGIISSFQALGQTGGYLPIIVLAIVITLILGYIFAMVDFRKPGSGSGPGGL